MTDIKTNVSLAEFTRFKTGGAAEFFAEPQNTTELIEILQNNHHEITVLGMGSNVLVRDGGIKGLVIYTGKMNWINATDAHTIIAGAGAPMPAIANFALAHGIMGFEFMIGIPGTGAGGLSTNAGCFGGQISDVLKLVKGVFFNGKPKELSVQDCKLSYRSANLPPNFMVTELHFNGKAGDAAEIRQKMQHIINKKNEIQPTDARTAGSAFKNPVDVPAWKKIKDAFPDGLKIGGAHISEKHANFIVAEEECTSQDIENITKKIQSETGLELEIKILGAAQSSPN